MTDVLILGAAAAAGYALAVHTWPRLRIVLIGVERELAWLRARAAALEAKLRDAFGGRR